MKQITVLFICSVLISSCSFLGIRSGYEQPRYEVVDRFGEFIEIRAYEPRLVAEASVEGMNLAEGSNASFRLLFDYISGGNQTAAKISMTSPVESAKTSEKITMTAPVETSRTEDSRVYMRFFLPGKYDRETAPKPLDQRVRIINIPAQTIAVLRFSGLGNEKTVAAKKRELLNALAETSWRPASTSVVYFYDPPWTITLFRRNEVVVAVVR
jgi:hypothetical protein